MASEPAGRRRMAVDTEQLLNILEASLLVAGKPMKIAQMEGLFEHELEKPSRDDIRQAIVRLQESYASRGIELVEVASGFRMQARQEYAPWVTNLFQERAPRYSRALLETLVLIAYRQPITRGEIEDVRGVAVSSNIIKTLVEREWVRVLGHREVPGRPAILGTTREFLDYFNLKRLDELPTLSEIKDLDQIDPELAKEIALLETTQEVVDGDNSDSDDSGENEAEAETEVVMTDDNAELPADGDLPDIDADLSGVAIELPDVDSADPEDDLPISEARPDTRQLSPVSESETLH